MHPRSCLLVTLSLLATCCFELYEYSVFWSAEVIYQSVSKNAISENKKLLRACYLEAGSRVTVISEVGYLDFNDPSYVTRSRREDTNFTFTLYAKTPQYLRTPCEILTWNSSYCEPNTLNFTLLFTPCVFYTIFESYDKCNLYPNMFRWRPPPSGKGHSVS